MRSERETVCKVCGGGLKKSDKLPARPGYEIHKYKCEQCGRESRVEIDTRFA